MKQVEEFAFLERVVSSNSKFTRDIEKIRAGVTRAFGTLRRKLWRRIEISLKVKMNI